MTTRASFPFVPRSREEVRWVRAAWREAGGAGGRAGPVWILQMGKVGSMAVAASLKAAGLDSLHLHTVSPDVYDLARQHRRAGVHPLPYHLWLGACLRWRRRLASDPACPLRVITLVREPVAMQVSAMFQTPAFFPGFEVGRRMPDDAFRAAVEAVLLDPETARWTDGWFDRELSGVFGLDVWQHPFPTERGWSIVESESAAARLLILRSDRIDEVAPEALRDFLGLREPVPVVSANRRSDAVDWYREAVDGLRLSPAAVARAMEFRLARHFFSAAERESLARRWTAREEGR